MKRPPVILTAAVITFLSSLFSVIGSIPFLARGVAATAQANDSPPYFILVLGLVLGVLGIVAAWGLWNNQRWGKILTIFVVAINGLSALPGVFFAPSNFLRVAASATVLVGVVVIVLVLWPARQSAAARA